MCVCVFERRKKVLCKHIVRRLVLKQPCMNLQGKKNLNEFRGKNKTMATSRFQNYLRSICLATTAAATTTAATTSTTTTAAH